MRILLLITVIVTMALQSIAQTVTDSDGNIYNTVTIGTQVWMKENLQVTKYNNGDLIGTTTPVSLDISSESAPEYQWPAYGSDSLYYIHGRIYTWFAATDSRKVCPVGWHLPGDADWTELIDYLGGSSVAGGKLKSYAHWDYPNTGANNQSGFSGLPGGGRASDGTFFDLGATGTWWSSTPHADENAGGLVLYATSSSAGSNNESKKSGYAVRCLQGEEPVIIVVPVITTAIATDILITSANSGGTITDDGGASVTARGVCWSTNESPTISDSKTEDGEGMGSFISVITGLTQHTIYYVRAYATNSEGTGYGNQISFTTQEEEEEATLPIVATSSNLDVSFIYAICRGNITNDGGASVAARGTCWSTEQAPTLSDNFTSDGTGVGSFTSFIEGLSMNTTYYVCAYATNSVGTSYGAAIPFTTLMKTDEEIITDIEGNAYTTITIGSQKWLAENLKTTTYNTGLAIPSGAYRWYNNDSATYGNLYGALYKWSTVSTGNLCPSGWHVPDTDELTAMEHFLIANGYNYDGTTAGNKIAKALASTTHWNSSSLAGAPGNTDFPEYRNKTGFTALPGGSCSETGFFGDLGDQASIWSASEYNSGVAHFWLLYTQSSAVGKFSASKNDGLSVRCVENNSASIATSIKSADIIFYPNPANEILYVENYNHANTLVQIFDLQGKQILIKHIDSGTVNISTLKNGVYLIKLTDSDHVLITKLIKEYL
jgi:uncharacterized protein (TIGR02145 family)